ncbi:MAG: ABC transporter permease [Blastocatellia bacterium]|nr:ABC transporter permease [Blastocatellia bacterium]MCS7157689.1 ABC transporter permease [Blastocatellia bacterium]MCX7751954.1 ABC transporter permease [Blastocatellia bacterium]MDW8167060.1 ABC transporter permease [Acidobacteriota bacterium]MDW8257164.1 ABC transporter permease [Acidobacteriota bacterium]
MPQVKDVEISLPIERKVGFPPARLSAGLLATISLWHRELIRFYRQRSRVLGVIGSPLVFWWLVGSGLGDSFRANGHGTGYLQYFFPGTVLLIVLFTSIFCMMSVIEDRHAGFLQSVLAAPIPRAALVLGKVLGGTTLATLQGAILLPLAPFVGISLTLGQAVGLVAFLFLLAFGITAFGFFLAWRLDSTHGFHAVVNLILIPMWLVSGALFPMSGASPWVAWLMRVNPLTYSTAGLQRLLFLQHPQAVTQAPSFSLALGVTLLFSLLAFLLALVVVARRPYQVTG